ncbi:uncharacterized protein LOC131151336 [Malania oleifera]|uniref:uncharacterized protein LOC131151336 n=1 Tax=Malania oleifera TaxID=397392 RepID=UPI0025AE52B3|nr:uncharacterized protein LOC131151336 [Malania oleifera]
MKITYWNIKGFNKPLKENGVLDLMKKTRSDLICILETKLSMANLKSLMEKKFSRWKQVNNFESHRAGRILVRWNPYKVHLQVVESNGQVIHCSTACLISSTRFLANSDRDSAFFHSLVKSTTKNHVAVLTKRNGETTKSMHQVGEEFLTFFKELLGSEINYELVDPCVITRGPKVSLEQGGRMIQEVTNMKIKNALFSIGDDKSPGPDGFSSCFFKKSWNIIEKEFVIKLMTEKIYLVQELVRKYARKKVFPRCMLKIDLKRAYDSVSWSFLKELLVHLNFPGKMFGWIMHCISTTSYSLAFTYDLIIFGRGDLSFVKEIMGRLNSFFKCLGLNANVLKSNFFSVGIAEQDMDDIKTLTGFNDREFPFRYLVIPLASSRLKAGQYSPLINRIANLISS